LKEDYLINALCIVFEATLKASLYKQTKANQGKDLLNKPPTIYTKLLKNVINV